MVPPLLKRALILLAALALLAAPLLPAEAAPAPAMAGMAMPCDGPDSGGAKAPPGAKDMALQCAAAGCVMTSAALLGAPALTLPSARDGAYAPVAERLAAGLSSAPDPSPPKARA